jgi:TRAP-type C4-dicarboxylate transport system substrate-binding protein
MQVFPDSYLGTAHEILDGLRFGNIEMGILSSDILTSLSPLLSGVSMPYIFRDDTHRFRVWDGPVGVQILNSLEKRNLIGLGFLDTGMRNLVTKQQHIKAPDDLQGMKVGSINDCLEDDCPNLPLQLSRRTLAAMGAVVETIREEEMDEALQSERIAGWESNEPDCISLKIFETGAIYFTYTRHTSIPDVLVASKIWFDRLSPEMQDAIRRAARLTVRHQRILWADFVRESISQLQTAGMRFEIIEREPFFEAVQPVYAEMYEELGLEFEEIVQAIMAVK